MIRIIRQTWVIARRDFVATVFTPTFLTFLLAPLLMIGFSLVGGASAAMMADRGDDRQRMIVLATGADRAILIEADTRLRAMFRFSDAPAPLIFRAPGRDARVQALALINADGEGEDGIETDAVMFGPLNRPVILRDARGGRDAAYLGQLAEQALRDREGGHVRSLSKATVEQVSRTGSSGSGRQVAGFAALFAIFFLTLMLSGQAVGMLAEEKSSKAIEILAAAVQLEAVFMGKLLGLFGVALLFIGFWATLLAQAATLMPPTMMALTELRPALGGGLFGLLFGSYFAMAYLLLGAMFLGVGAQASTMREVQMLSLPLSIFQVAMFGLSAAAAASPGSTVAMVAAIFPFSSPFAMATRAATDTILWPHLLALAWQALWVVIIVRIASGWFRKGVLKSGGGWKSLFGRQ